MKILQIRASFYFHEYIHILIFINKPFLYFILLSIIKNKNKKAILTNILQLFKIQSKFSISKHLNRLKKLFFIFKKIFKAW